MYDAVRLFLEALKTEPTSIPFAKYLVLRGGNLANIHPGMRLLPALCGTSGFCPRMGTMLDLMQKAPLQSAMRATYRGMTGIWTQINKSR